MRFLPSLLICALIFTPSHAVAAPTCHCFQQRGYNPDNPQSVEPYLLATTSNSLLSVVLNIPKRQIVKSKMSGTPDEDVWISLVLADSLGKDYQELILEKSRAGSWGKVVQRLRPNPENIDPQFMAALLKGEQSDRLAEVALTATLNQHFTMDQETLERTLARGLARQKLVLAALITLQQSLGLEEVIQRAESATGGWAILSETSGIDLDQLEAHWLMVLENRKAAD